MIREMTDRSVSAWKQNWGDGLLQYVLLAALLLLLIAAIRKNRDARLVLVYSMAALALFFCPFTEYVLIRAIGKSVYWRVLWILPTGIVTAYAFTLYLSMPKKEWIRVPGILAVLALIVLCGRSQRAAGNYVLTHNRPQVPDEVAQIAEVIRGDVPEGEALAAVDDHVASYLRVYDASIRMPYGRRADGALNKDCVRLYEMLQTPGSDPKTISDLARSQECTHLVVYQPGPEGMELYQAEGWQEIGEADGYYILAAAKAERDPE